MPYQAFHSGAIKQIHHLCLDSVGNKNMASGVKYTGSGQERPQHWPLLQERNSWPAETPKTLRERGAGRPVYRVNEGEIQRTTHLYNITRVCLYDNDDVLCSYSFRPFLLPDSKGC